MWDSEPIPGEATLLKRVHRHDIDDTGKPKPGAFRNTPSREDGMSTDWAFYSTASETRRRARVPADNMVISLNVDKVRAIIGQTVQHTPVQPDEQQQGNRSHTDVFGEKTTEARLKYMQIFAIELPLEAPT